MSSWSTDEDRSLESAAEAVPSGSQGRWRLVADTMGSRKSPTQYKTRFEELRASKRARHNSSGRGKGSKGKGKNGKGYNSKGKRVNMSEAAVLAEAVPGSMELDGAILEGGGQVIRQSISLSVLLGRPVSIRSIRAGRSRPGLQYQHCTGVELAGRLCGATIAGCVKDSCTLAFSPDRIQAPERQPVVADIGTAGAVLLLLQVALPIGLWCNSGLQLELRGGTNATNAPQIDYAQLVLLPTLRKMGVTAELSCNRRGFYPRGRGQAVVRIEPLKQQLQPLELLERGEAVMVDVMTFSAGKANGMAAEMATQIRQGLQAWQELSTAVEIRVNVTEETEKSAFGDGFGAVLVLHTSTGCIMAGSEIGDMKQGSAVEVAAAALAGLKKSWAEGGCVDEYLQDQLIVYMALAAGTSAVLMGPLTLHTRTAIHFAELLSEASFRVTEQGRGTILVECDGVGYQQAP